ncbi:PIN domain-like protein [Syncephalis plumigaleata]|nr:PIN domain-like protein [Syncephalis plumigaleata]
MPVRQLDYFMAERRLVQTSPLHLLRDTRLGIDGNYWLRRVLQQSAKEPAAVAMGGSPNGLRAALEKELNLFKTQEIHPFFVFHGITLPRKERAFSTEDLRPAKRASAWDAYDKGRVEQAYSGWSASGGIAPVELVNVAIKVLHEHDIEFMRAPYSSWAQLVYLEKHPDQPIHAIYGATELLMLDVDRIITSIDLEKGSFAWVSKRALLHDLQLTEDQFLDTCILAGCDYCSTFPVLTVDPISFNFKIVYDMVRQYRSGYNAVHFFAQHPEVLKTRYEDVFCRVKSAMRHHLVMTTNGTVQPLNMEQVPSDIHEFMGPRLPDEVYNYLTQGLIAPQRATSRAGTIV